MLALSTVEAMEPRPLHRRLDDLADYLYTAQSELRFGTNRDPLAILKSAADGLRALAAEARVSEQVIFERATTRLIGALGEEPYGDAGEEPYPDDVA